jgi:hypothetical protein
MSPQALMSRGPGWRTLARPQAAAGGPAAGRLPPALAPGGFSATERAQLLLAPRLGPKFVQNLERAGFRSMAEMRALGVQRVLQRVSQVLELPLGANRAQALAAAIGQHTGPASLPARWPAA